MVKEAEKVVEGVEIINVEDKIIDSRHNQVAYSIPSGGEVDDMLTFLLRSRILKLIFLDCQLCTSQLKEFWANASLDTGVSPSVINSIVQGKSVRISVEILRRIFDLKETDNDPMFFDDRMVKGCLRRMHYSGPINTTKFTTSFFPKQFKYLADVLIQCLGLRGGSDVMSPGLVHAMVALVLNRPFNFAGFIMHNLKANMTSADKIDFNMYPRFLQICLNLQISKLDGYFCGTLHVAKLFAYAFKSKKGYRKGNEPKGRSLFGALIDADYKPPSDEKWRHDNSGSETEEMEDYLPNTFTLKEGDVDIPNKRMRTTKKSAKKLSPKDKGKKIANEESPKPEKKKEKVIEKEEPEKESSIDESSDSSDSGLDPIDGNQKIHVAKKGYEVKETGVAHVQVKVSKKRNLDKNSEIQVAKKGYEVEQIGVPHVQVKVLKKRKSDKNSDEEIIGSPIPKVSQVEKKSTLRKKRQSKPRKVSQKKIEKPVVEEDDSEKTSRVTRNYMSVPRDVLKKSVKVSELMKESKKVNAESTQRQVDQSNEINLEDISVNIQHRTKFAMLQSQIDQLISENKKLNETVDDLMKKNTSLRDTVGRQQLEIMNQNNEIVVLKHFHETHAMLIDQLNTRLTVLEDKSDHEASSLQTQKRTSPNTVNVKDSPLGEENIQKETVNVEAIEVEVETENVHTESVNADIKADEEFAEDLSRAIILYQSRVSEPEVVDPVSLQTDVSIENSQISLTMEERIAVEILNDLVMKKQYEMKCVDFNARGLELEGVKAETAAICKEFEKYRSGNDLLETQSMEKLGAVSANCDALKVEVVELRKERAWLLEHGFVAAFEKIKDSKEYDKSLSAVSRAMDGVGRQRGLREGFSWAADGKKLEEHPYYRADEGLPALDSAMSAFTAIAPPILDAIARTAADPTLDSFKNLVLPPASDASSSEE